MTVEDPNTGEAVDFTCQRWFSSSDDDGKISRELTRDDKDDETIVDKGECNDRTQNKILVISFNPLSPNSDQHQILLVISMPIQPP